jgi:hypothetical protein
MAPNFEAQLLFDKYLITITFSMVLGKNNACTGILSPIERVTEKNI